MSTRTVLPRTVAGGHTALAALALVLVIAGASLFAAPHTVFDLSLSPGDWFYGDWFYAGLLAAWFLPPLIGVLLQAGACKAGRALLALW